MGKLIYRPGGPKFQKLCPSDDLWSFPSTYLTLNGGADEESKGVGPRQQAVLFPPPGHDQRHVEPHDERHQRRGAAAGRAKLTHPLEQPATNTLGEYRCLELCVRQGWSGVGGVGSVERSSRGYHNLGRCLNFRICLVLYPKTRNDEFTYFELLISAH